MKKNLWLKIIPTAFCLFIILLSTAQAADLSNAFAKNTISPAAGNAYNTNTSIYEITGTIIQVLLGILGVLFIGLVIYGGIIWMIAEGDEAKIEKAKSIITSAVIGLIVVIAAYAISYFVVSVLNKATLVQ
jgi:Type IV secretion system pilin